MFLVVVTTLVFFVFVTHAQAATITWDGGGATNNWSEDANWSGNVEPGTSDLANFTGASIKDATIDTAISVQGIDVNAGYAGGTITQASGQTISIGSGDFDISAGTFVGGNSDITTSSAGSFTVSGGIFTSTTANLTLGNTFTVSSGTFNESTGTVTATQATQIWDVVTTETFYNLTINKTGGEAITMSTSDTFVVLNTLTLTDGAINGATGVIDARNAITQGGNFDGGTATINFGDNAVSQTYSINGGTTPVIQLDHASDASDSITMTAGATFTGLTITSGFSGAIPLNNSSNFTLVFASWSQAAGTYDASAQTGWNMVDFDISAGTFTAPALVTATSVAATWDVNSSQTFTALTINKSNTVTLTMGTGDTFVVTGALTLTNGAVATGTLDARGSVTVGSLYDGGTATLNFGGTATQAFDLTGATGLYAGDITVNKSSGQVNLSSALVLDDASQDLTLQEGKLSLGGQALTVNGASGTFVIEDGGHLQLQGAETMTLNATYPTLSTGSTVTYTGDGDSATDTYTVTTLKAVYHHLVINSTDGATDTFQLGAALDINGNLTNTAGTFDVSASSHAITLAGNWSNTGTFNGRAGTVTLDPDTNHTLTGDTTWFSLTLLDATSNATDVTLTLPASSTQTISGVLTLDGLDEDDRLNIVSSSAGLRGIITFTGTGSFVGNYLDIIDSTITDNSSLVTAPVMPASSVNRGNTTLWFKSSSFIGGVGSGSPTLELISPNGGEIFTAGDSMLISWQLSGMPSSHIEVGISVDGGLTYTQLAVGVNGFGNLALVVPDMPSTTTRFRIQGTDLIVVAASDESDADFTILSSSSDEALSLDEQAAVVGVTGPINVAAEVEHAHSYIRGTSFPTVYYVDANGRRHPFGDELTYFSHQDSFDSVITVSDADLANHPMGSPMLPKPGAVLVKIQSLPEVYFVTEDSAGDYELRWVPDEATALDLFGPTWSEYVVDVEATMWTHYRRVTDLTRDTTLVDSGQLRTRTSLK